MTQKCVSPVAHFSLKFGNYRKSSEYGQTNNI